MHKLLLPLSLAALVHLPTFAQTQTLQSQTAHDGRMAPVVAAAPAVHPSGVLTLAAALDLARDANPEISAARREVEANDGAVRQAGFPRNPELAAAIEDTRQATRTTTLQLNQPIELGGKRRARVTAAERGRDAAVADLAAKQADVRAAVVSAFYDVLIAQERHRLAQASIALAQQASNAASRRVSAGKVSPVEETKARIAESGVRIELAQAAGELARARKRLTATWGSSVPGFERADGDVDTLPDLPALSGLVQRLRQSPDLMRARIEVDRRQALSQVERARQTPDITVSIGAKRDEQLGRTQAILGVSIPLPFFDRNQGNLQEALRRTDKARDQLTAAEVRLDSDLAQAHERLQVARQEAQLLQRDILPGAQSAYDAATKGFEFGKFDFLDVLDAQRTLLQAKSQFLRALSEGHRAAAEIERLVGDATTGPTIMPVATKP
jgi:cobalt-zinc-cadmium efflux system outer membrane protein